MYAILIKDKSNLYRFLTVKQDIMREESEEITDPDTQEVRTETTLVPTGDTEVVRFETDSREKLEAKCIEILGTYNKNQFMAINTEPFEMDLLWNSEKENNE
ncbi:MAG: hypothetical protein HDQ99_02395 [Lachnospiraceae bacterium]|nr:hypothetical protein [Lachnospiraceae bacterium]